MIYSPHYSETNYGRRKQKQKRKETEPRRPSACADADLAGQYAVYSGTGILRLSDLRAEQLAASKQGNQTCEEKTGWLLEIQKLVEQYLKK